MAALSRLLTGKAGPLEERTSCLCQLKSLINKAVPRCSCLKQHRTFAAASRVATFPLSTLSVLPA